YQVNRYNNSNSLQTTGAACSGTVASTSCTESSVPDGTWKYGVQAKFHNWLGAESSQITVVVDTSKPTISAEPASVSANAAPSFSFTHTQPSYTFKCQLDGGGFAACSSPKVYSSLANGSHTFQVEGIDSKGNATQVASYSWTIDRSAPSITSEPSSTSATTAPSFSFSHTQAS